MYKTMAETRAGIIILDEYINIRLWSKMHKYYQGLGYDGEYGDFIRVRVSDLPSGSNEKVLAECPVCGVHKHIAYCKIVSRGHTMCLGCLAIKDITGMTFGRWVVVSFDKTEKKNAFWNVVCECGNTGSVKYDMLARGKSTSCGCYHREATVLSNSGSNNYAWTGPDIVKECLFCGNKFGVRPHRNNAKFCCWECMMSSMRNPELTDEERIIKRSYPEYRQYIQSVLHRDNYTCQICGSVENIEVHHMFSYGYYPKYRIDTEFGLSMCKSCHVDFHSWNGGKKKKCIPADIDRWLYETSCTIGD